MRRAGEMLDVRYRKMNQLFMSGDISFSYPYDKAAIKKLADEKFYKTLDPLKGTDWALIFSRENNFGVGKGMRIYLAISSCFSDAFQCGKFSIELTRHSLLYIFYFIHQY